MLVMLVRPARSLCQLALRLVVCAHPTVDDEVKRVRLVALVENLSRDFEHESVSIHDRVGSSLVHLIAEGRKPEKLFRGACCRH
jgi:hypothetical protein